MRHLSVQLVLCVGLLALTAAAVRAERIELTNSTAATVDGDTRTSPPDAMPTIRTVEVLGTETAFGSGEILDVDITINFSKLSDPDAVPQPWYNEIGFALLSPDGTLVELIPIGTFLGPPNFNNTPGFSGIVTLDDAAASVVNNGPIAGRPNAGTFQPIGALSAFNGEKAQGVWQLWIEDSISANPLEFFSFTLSIQTGPAAVPEPGSVVLGSMALLALAGYAWRKRRRA